MGDPKKTNPALPQQHTPPLPLPLFFVYPPNLLSLPHFQLQARCDVVYYLLLLLRCKVGNILWHKHATCNNVAVAMPAAHGQLLIASFSSKQQYVLVLVGLGVCVCVCGTRIKGETGEQVLEKVLKTRIQYHLHL